MKVIIFAVGILLTIILVPNTVFASDNTLDLIEPDASADPYP